VYPNRVVSSETNSCNSPSAILLDTRACWAYRRAEFAHEIYTSDICVEQGQVVWIPLSNGRDPS
jgi:hypothetical protein